MIVEATRGSAEGYPLWQGYGGVPRTPVFSFLEGGSSITVRPEPVEGHILSVIARSDSDEAISHHQGDATRVTGMALGTAGIAALRSPVSEGDSPWRESTLRPAAPLAMTDCVGGGS